MLLAWALRLLSTRCFHFAPLLVLTVGGIALVFGQQRAQAGLVEQARQMVGDRGGDTVKLQLSTAQKRSSGLIASIIAFVRGIRSLRRIA
jgi:uncharacterized BrkB/YihY/UPF0761 family membrane protein